MAEWVILRTEFSTYKKDYSGNSVPTPNTKQAVYKALPVFFLFSFQLKAKQKAFPFFHILSKRGWAGEWLPFSFPF